MKGHYPCGFLSYQEWQEVCNPGSRALFLTGGGGLVCRSLAEVAQWFQCVEGRESRSLWPMVGEVKDGQVWLLVCSSLGLSTYGSLSDRTPFCLPTHTSSLCLFPWILKELD